MNIDRKLIYTAEEHLIKQFPLGSGRACAAYSNKGKIFTGISKPATHSSVLEAEIEPIRESQKTGELITGLVTLGWDGPGSSIVVHTPTLDTLKLLQGQARRHAQIAVGGVLGAEPIAIQPLWELVQELNSQYYSNTALMKGHFGNGMKAIANNLREFANNLGVSETRAKFSDILIEELRHEDIRRNANQAGFQGSKFLMPTYLKSISLRHIWLAFERASEEFVFDFIDSLRPQLTALGCNEADGVHIKQGLEALRNIFSVLLVFVGTRRQVDNECPFYPYDSSILQSGIPMHLYIRCDLLDETASEDSEAYNTILVRQLIAILSERQNGGFTSYLRQRELFKVDLFDGGGAGHCPFFQMSNEMIYETASGLEKALNEGIIIL